MQIRLWKGSPLIGKTVGEIIKDYGVTVIKVARGREATNPPPDLVLKEADYISYVGQSKECLDILKLSIG